ILISVIIIGSHYNLYPLPDTPALDAYTNLRHWLEFLTHYYHQGKPLSSDQLIFPSITSKTGDIHFSTPLSVERVNQFLEEFGKSANNENVSTYLVNHLFSTILIYVP